MRLAWYLGVVGLITLLSVSSVQALYSSKANPSVSQQPARLLVKLKAVDRQDNSFGKQRGGDVSLASLEAAGRRLGITRLEYLRPKLVNGDPQHPLNRLVVMDVPADADLPNLLQQLECEEFIEYVQPDWPLQLFTDSTDPWFAEQWALHNTGQEHYQVDRYDGYLNDTLRRSAGEPDADIDALEALRDSTKEGDEVVVAIIDTGVDIFHPDLVGRIWINSRELPANGLDDDHNGYVDDYRGWDFCGDASVLPPEADNDPSDELGHGTHCAGIIAATIDNGVGISGISRECRLLVLKIYPMMLISAAAEAIVYAADNGADVISMSFGSPFASPLLEEVAVYARAKGVVLCAATGNSFAEEKAYPAALEEVIAVGASDHRDQVTVFSSFGDHLDLVAPGMAIISLKAHSLDMYSALGEPVVHIIGDDYYLASGTSMACPHVAGTAAVMRSISPGLVPDSVAYLIGTNADDILDPYGRDEELVGWDKYSGHGRLNLAEAAKAVPDAWARIVRPSPHQFISGEVAIEGSAWSEAGTVVEYGVGNLPTEWTEIGTISKPVRNGFLTNWNTQSLDGQYTLRLRSGPANLDVVTLFVANQTVADITSPRSGETICTWSSIEGSAHCAEFVSYRIDYSSEKQPHEWRLLEKSSRPVARGQLTHWNAGSLADGWYTLRLQVTATTGIVDSSLIRVYVSSPFAGTQGWRLSFAADLTTVPNYGDFDGDGVNEIVLGTAEGVKLINLDGSIRDSSSVSGLAGDCRTPIPVGQLDFEASDDFACICDDHLYLHKSGSIVDSVRLFRAPSLGAVRIGADCPLLYLEDIDGSTVDEIHYYPGALSERYIYSDSGTLVMTFAVEGHGPWSNYYLPADLDNNNIDELYLCNGIRIREYTPSKSFRRASLDLRFAVIGDYRGFFTATNMTGVDFDADGKVELVVLGYVKDGDVLVGNYWLFAFDEQLNLIPGWARDTGISAYWACFGPTFADLDLDGVAEYFLSTWTSVQGRTYGWRLDGSPYVASSENALFSTCREPAIAQWPLSADLDGDARPELLLRATHDLFYSHQVERLEAWDADGQSLPGWPLETGSPVPYSAANHTPLLGDINDNGVLDILMTTVNDELLFTEFAGVPYDAASTPLAMWRGNRSFNNIVPWRPQGTPTATEFVEDIRLPDQFSLNQNYPNPFNAGTTISYTLPTPSEVSLEVYNILGQLVDKREFGYQSTGSYRIDWPGGSLRDREFGSGVYFYRLQSGQQSLTRKMLLLK